MKKLFALVMVLAMALAIAVPAMASGWDQITTEPANLKDITVKVTALEVNPNTSVLGSLYEQLSVMYPVVKGTDVHFYVEITIPKKANLSQANQDLLKNKGLLYELGYTNNLAITSMYTYTNNDAATPTVTKSAALTGVNIVETQLMKDNPVGSVIYTNCANVFGYEYFGEGLASGDCKITANISFNNTWDAAVFGWDNDADGIDEFTVTHAGLVFEVAAVGATPVSSVEFTVVDNTTGKINVAAEMIFNYGALDGSAGHEFAVNRAVNGDITFRPMSGGDVITPASTSYAAMKAAFDAYFTALGFGYADAKYMTEPHFTKYFGTISEATASITYPSGTVVVTDPTVNPPQTGDATTVAGFVMIALALVAAAAVTVKKVRA